jgi:hypothetical protein
MAHATFAGIRKYFDGRATGSATAHGRTAAALAGVEQDAKRTVGEHYLHERSLDRRAVRDRVFTHIMTFNAHRRLMALDALRQLGVQTEGFGDPMEYEESVAPWNREVILRTP